MCLSPQPHAFFQHKHVQKCSEDDSFLTFSLANVPIRTSKSAPKTTVFQHFHFRMCFSPKRRAICRHRNFKKCSEDYSFSTFSLPNMLFATAACNFSTSELQKVLRPQFFNIFTAKCAFRLSTSELPKVLRRLQFFNIFTSKCAFRHSGVQFCDISTYKSALRTAVF